MPSQPTPDRETHEYTIPINSYSGIVGHALVDAEDYARLACHRWCLSGRYAMRWAHKHSHRILMHHAVLWPEGLPPGMRIDHVNRNPLDNRKSNLRIATTAHNAQNQDSRGGRSKYRGVVWDKPRQQWRAQAMLHGKCYNLGRFNDEEEAARTASRWRAENMPFSEDALRQKETSSRS